MMNAQTVMVGVALGLLAIAAWRDLALRLIPDWISISLAIMGIASRLAVGWLDMAFSVATALVLFFLLLMAFSRGLIGGGDVKLVSALVLWLSPPACYELLVTTALAGGVLAILHLAVRGLAPVPVAGGVLAGPSGWTGRRLLRVELKRIHARGPLPYGVAIMVGGGYALLGTLGG